MCLREIPSDQLLRMRWRNDVPLRRNGIKINHLMSQWRFVLELLCLLHACDVMIRLFHLKQLLKWAEKKEKGHEKLVLNKFIRGKRNNEYRCTSLGGTSLLNFEFPKNQKWFSPNYSKHRYCRPFALNWRLVNDILSIGIIGAPGMHVHAIIPVHLHSTRASSLHSLSVTERYLGDNIKWRFHQILEIDGV